MDIERHSFEWPWGEDDFRHTTNSQTVTCLVAEHDCEVVGYVVFERMESAIFVSNLAVHAKYRHSGFGTQLMDAVKDRVRNRIKRVIADVSEYSDPSQLFLRSQGFICTEILYDYFDEDIPPQDAYRFVWEPSYVN